MKDNFYDKFSAILAGINEDDAEYILRCVRAPKEEIKQISERLNSFYRELLARSEILNKAEDDFFKRNEKLCALVRKYNDSLISEGIWNSVDSSEAKTKLNTFYSLLAAMEKLDEVDLPQIGIDELTENDMELGRSISLLKRALFVLPEYDKTEAEKIISKYGLCHSLTEEITRKNAALFEKTAQNEAVLGKYIASLALALDEKGKGERMNLSLARNSADVFFSNYIKEK